MRKKIALLTMVAMLPVFALATTDGGLHGVELKKAHHVAINRVTVLPEEKVRVTATLTYADSTKSRCTYVMAASVLKQDAGAGIWMAPYPNGEKCIAAK